MDEELITVRTYRFPQYAEADKMHLQAEEIPAFIADDNVVTWDWLLGQAIGFVKLQVPASYAEVAQKILDLHQPGQDLAEYLPEAPEAIRCLACGERMLKDEPQCPACGWSYAETVEEAAAEAPPTE